MANIGTFRTALNGFNRQDVTSYLEAQAARINTMKEENRELAMRVQSLRGELDTARGEAAAAAGERDAEKARAAEAQQALQDRVAALEAETEALKNSLTEAENEAAGLRTALTEARDMLAATDDKATAYDTLRERLSALEVNASRRAVEIERNAETAALEVRKASEKADAEARMHREELNREFRGRLQRASVDTTLIAKLINGELTRLNDQLAAVTDSLESAANIFSAPEESAAVQEEENA